MAKKIYRCNVSPPRHAAAYVSPFHVATVRFHPPTHFVTTVSPIPAPLINLNLLKCYFTHAASYFIMSLRTHLDRYCQQRAMANDHISPTRRSRSPNRAPSSATGTSPFQRPPDWTPPSTTPHRPVILQLDLKPMQQLAARNPYFNILAPKVAGNLSTETYDSLFQTFKVIYPDYARSHFVSDLKTVVTDTILQRWSIHLQASDFYMMIDTDQGAQMLDDLPHSLLDILNWYYPSWKTHQHLDAFTPRECASLVVTPHPDPQDTGFAVHIQVIPRGHPFVTATRYTKNATWISRHPIVNSAKKRQKGRSWKYSGFSADHHSYQISSCWLLVLLNVTANTPPFDVLSKFIVDLPLANFGFSLLSTLYSLLLYMANHSTDGLHRMLPAPSSMTLTNTTGPHLPPDDPTSASYIPRAARMIPTSTTVHTIFIKKLSYPFTSRPDELWIVEQTADGRDTWKPVETFFGKHAPHAWPCYITYYSQQLAPVLRHTHPIILFLYGNIFSGSPTSWTFQRPCLTTVWCHTGSTTHSPILLGTLCSTSLTGYHYFFILATMEIYTTILTINNTSPDPTLEQPYYTWTSPSPTSTNWRTGPYGYVWLQRVTHHSALRQ